MTVVQPELGTRRRRRRRDSRRDRRRPRRHAVRRGGRGLGQDEVARRSRRRARHPRRRADAGDRRGHVHREGRRRAARPHPPRARADRDQLAVRARSRRRARPRRARRARRAPRCPPCTRSRSGSSAENPIEAGLPPRIEVLDDIGSQVAFEERWTRFVDQLLDDPALERTLLLALNADTSLAVLRTHRARVQRQLGPRARAHGPRARPAAARRSTALARRRSTTVSRARELRAPTPTTSSPSGCVELAAWPTGSSTRPTSTSSSGCSPRASRRSARTRGRRATGRRRATCDAVRAAGRRRCASRPRRSRDAVTEATVRRLAWEIAQFTLREADERRRTRPARVPRPARARPRGAARPRARLGRPAPPARPLHAPAARRVPGHRPHPVRPRRAARVGRPDARDRRWNEIAVDPGRLFVVGDPKQSIYRFRRADIAAFLRARSAFGAAPRHLTRNFRTARPVIEFVNHVFRELIVAEPESQPEYVALDPDRGDAPGRPGSGAARRRARTKTGRAPTSCASARRPTSPRPSPPRSRERLVGRRGADADGTEVVGAVPPGRHRDPAAGAHVARSARGRARRRRHPVPGRDVVARLRHARDPRPARGAAGRRRPHRRARAGERAALAAVRLRRRRPLHVPASSTAATGTTRRRCPSRCRPTIRSARRCARSRRGTTRGCGSARASCSTASCASGACSRSAFAHGRPRDLWRRVRFVIDQARAFSSEADAGGSGLRDFLAWADLQSSRGRARRRDRAARDRRRRGAHPHHPRRQGPRVPDHDRVGHDHQASQARRAGVQLLLPARLRHLRAPRVDAGHHRGVRALRADRRADGLPREAAAPLRGADPRARPPRRVGAPPGERSPTRRPHEVDPRRAAVARRRRARRTGTALAPVADDLAARARDAAGRARVRTPPWDDWVARARPRALAHGVAAARAVGHRAAREPRRRRARRAPTPAWPRTRATSSCRRGTRAATAPRSGARCTRCSRPSTSRPAPASTTTAAAQAAAEGVIGREDDIAALARGALASRTVREAVAATASAARCTSPRRSTAPRSRATSTSCTATRRAGRRRLQDRRVARRGRPRRQGGALPAPGRVVRGRARSRRRASRSPSACSCSSATDGADERAVSDLPAAMREVRALLAASSASRHEHQHAADRAGEHHQRGVAPGPPDVGADDHGHGDERHPHQAVEEADHGLARVVGRHDPEVEEQQYVTVSNSAMNVSALALRSSSLLVSSAKSGTAARVPCGPARGTLAG